MSPSLIILQYTAFAVALVSMSSAICFVINNIARNCVNLLSNCFGVIVLIFSISRTFIIFSFSAFPNERNTILPSIHLTLLYPQRDTPPIPKGI